MVCCYECGMEFKSRERNGEIQAYDVNMHKWSYECPNCGYAGFDKDDLIEEDDLFEESGDEDVGEYYYS